MMKPHTPPRVFYISARRRLRLVAVLALGLPSIAAASLASLSIGPAYVGLEGVLGALLGSPEVDAGVRAVVVNLRLPRVVSAIAIGAALSVAGAVLQALLRNPLVDPYILGISSGSALGAAATLLLGASLLIIPVAAFLSGMAAFSATLAIASLAGGTPLGIVLSGLAVGTALTSALTLLIYLSGEKAHYIVLWLTGSLSMSTWDGAAVLVAATSASLALVLLRARDLNASLLGEEQAAQLGVDVARLRREMMVVAAVLTSVSVSFAGVIGFIGLVTPHICRMAVGGDHRLLLPSSALVGALLLLLADLAAKTACMPAELPLGAITSLIGAPFFIYLLVRARGGYAL